MLHFPGTSALLAPSSRMLLSPFRYISGSRPARCRSIVTLSKIPSEEHQSVPRRKAHQALLAIGCSAANSLLQRSASQAAEDSERRGIGRYIKKKKLDPLDSYVPAVIAAKNQLQRAGRIMKENLQGARELLRNGAFDGLRDNIRAIGEYAQQGGAKDGKKLAEVFFQSVEAFDLTLFQAKRNDQPVGPDSDKALEQAVASIDALLATVPQNILEDSAKIVAAVEGSFQAQPTAPKEGSDKQLDQLMQLVPTQAS